MKKYKTGSLWLNKPIEVIEVVRETESSVFLPCSQRGGERREAKVSDYHAYFDTWEEAQGHLIKKAQFEVEKYTFHLNGANEYLDKAKSLVKPE